MQKARQGGDARVRVAREAWAILGLTGTGYASVVACAAGYRLADDPQAQMKKVRFKTEDVVVRI